MFRKRKQALYRYWDGRRKRRIDPLQAFRALHNDAQFNIKTHPILVDEGDDESVEIMLACIRRVFGVGKYDPEKQVGLTEQNTFALYVDFCDYIDRVKKNMPPSPTPPESTDATSNEFTAETTSDSLRSGSPSPVSG